MFILFQKHHHHHRGGSPESGAHDEELNDIHIRFQFNRGGVGDNGSGMASSSAPLRSIAPVSYTHLDVYKRQISTPSHIQ